MSKVSSYEDILNDSMDNYGIIIPEEREAILEAIPEDTYSGWVLVWWSDYELDLDAIGPLGMPFTSTEGPNALYIAPSIGAADLGNLVIGAADIAGQMQVLDLETFII
jgi:hypothetical protein